MYDIFRYILVSHFVLYYYILLSIGVILLHKIYTVQNHDSNHYGNKM